MCERTARRPRRLKGWWHERRRRQPRGTRCRRWYHRGIALESPDEKQLCQVVKMLSELYNKSASKLNRARITINGVPEIHVCGRLSRRPIQYRTPKAPTHPSPIP